MGHSDDFRPSWLALLATSAAILVLPVLLGWPHDWTASACLLVLVLAAWVLDPLTLAITFIAFAFACVIVVPRQAANPPWSPNPLMAWITIAITLLVRMELQVRQALVRKDAEMQAARDQQQEWRAFFDNSPAAILTADGEGRIIMGNRAAQKLLGCEDRPLQGMGLAPSLSALGAALRIERKSPLFHTLLGCTAWRPNGEMFLADAWFSVHEGTSGTRLGAVVVDASERLQDRARVGLRSTMATSQIAMGAVLHEIRNLSAAAALMYSNLVHSDAVQPAELQKNADFEALGSLLKALTNLAAVELRPGGVSQGSVDPGDALAQLRIIVDPWFQESEMSVKWDVAAGLPHVFGEESGLLQIFLNLTQNSHKAMLSSEPKELTIQARVEGEWVVVRFHDTGPGVANPDELFEPFRRSTDSTGIKGLGLFVSRAIAHSFYGELKYTPVESGSCFAIELLPLREWQKVSVEYESATVDH